jgi:hypothetical protein
MMKTLMTKMRMKKIKQLTMPHGQRTCQLILILKQSFKNYQGLIKELIMSSTQT